jgi:hypothetical protein
MRAILGTLTAVALAGALAIGCGNSTATTDDMGSTVRPDMMAEPGSDLGAPPDLSPACVSNPMTNVELLNACTTAQSYDKMPFYPTKAPNGVLPPLP